MQYSLVFRVTSPKKDQFIGSNTDSQKENYPKDQISPLGIALHGGPLRIQTAFLIYYLFYTNEVYLEKTLCLSSTIRHRKHIN